MGVTVELDKRMEVGDMITEVDPGFREQLDREYFHSLADGAPTILSCSAVLTQVQEEPYQSHLNSLYRCGYQWDKYRVVILISGRGQIDRVRNNAVRLAIMGGFDYLFFFDDDTVLPRDIYERLVRQMKEFNAASGSYFIRGYPFQPMVFEWADEERTRMKPIGHENYKARISEDGVLRGNVAGLGCGCTMFRVDDFKRVPYPWFLTGPNHTEDGYWFAKIQKEMPEYKIGMDFNTKCGHTLKPLIVDAGNVDLLRETYQRLQQIESGR